MPNASSSIWSVLGVPRVGTLMKGLKKTLRYFAKRFGFDIVRYEPKSHPLARRKQLLDSYNVDLVLDVGANTGQYATELREIGYRGRIVSFEPLSSAYRVLSEMSAGDMLWDTYNHALGDEEGDATINIAGNSWSSSLLDMLPAHVESEPESKYIGEEEIHIKTLDSVYPAIVKDAQQVYLKIDTQGFEEHVINGAKVSLKSIGTVQLEMSLTPLYASELLFDEMYQKLADEGYELVALEPGFTDEKTGRLMQVDGIFHRT